MQGFSWLLYLQAAHEIQPHRGFGLTSDPVLRLVMRTLGGVCIGNCRRSGVATGLLLAVPNVKPTTSVDLSYYYIRIRSQPILCPSVVDSQGQAYEYRLDTSPSTPRLEAPDK